MTCQESTRGREGADPDLEGEEMMQQGKQNNPREVVKSRLRGDLGDVEAADLRTAILCGELGCGREVQEFIAKHPALRYPYEGRVPDPKTYCERLRREYHAATGHGVEVVEPPPKGAKCHL